SFTRVIAPDEGMESARLASISGEEMDWLPAIEVSGEGVFLTLDQEVLRTWEKGEGPRRRVDLLRERHLGVLRRRAEEAGETRTPRTPVSPRFVLLHTLSHMLLNEWSLDAGYPASALRERLYVGPDMAGILIYTATSDSAGSLGGLVAQGRYDRLTTSLHGALGRHRW